jgi:Ribonuclease G/E
MSTFDDLLVAQTSFLRGNVESYEKEDVEEDEEEIRAKTELVKKIKPCVKEWFDLQSEIEVLQQAIRERRKKKKELDEILIQTMKQYEIPYFESQKNTKIEMNISKRRQPLSTSFIEDALKKYCSKEQVMVLTRLLFKERPVIEKSVLKFIKPKMKKT